MSSSRHILSMAMDVLVFTPIEDIRNRMGIDAEQQLLQTYIIRRWPQNKDDLEL